MINEVPFKDEKGEEEEIEPLTIEHFFLPQIFLVVGLVLSTLSFVAEIIIKHCQRNDQM